MSGEGASLWRADILTKSVMIQPISAAKERPPQSRATETVTCDKYLPNLLPGIDRIKFTTVWKDRLTRHEADI